MSRCCIVVFNKEIEDTFLLQILFEYIYQHHSTVIACRKYNVGATTCSNLCHTAVGVRCSVHSQCTCVGYSYLVGI